MKKSILVNLIILFCLPLAFGQFSIVLQPNGLEGKDVEVIYIYPNSNFGGDQQLNVTTWSNTGVLSHDRAYLDFNFDTIPAGAQITSAKLFLFNYPNSPTCGGMHQQLTGTNEMEVRRVTSDWNENTLTWNTQPSWTNTNMVITPPSTGPHQNYEIDVTAMVQDMIADPAGSFGFGLKLQTEIVYRSLIFASSDNSNPALHPKMEINYNLPHINQVDTCEYYTWLQNGQTYTQSGLYTDTLFSISGSDSIVYLDLVIHNDTFVHTSYTSCDEYYYWDALNDSLYLPGEYFASLQTASGCDSIILLDLTFASAQIDTITVTNCGDYYWSANGLSYSNSGFYQYYSVNSAGCDSILYLDLTINVAFEQNSSVTACDHYFWNVVNQNLSITGNYLAQYTTTMGCDSSYYLNLTIHESFYDTLNVQACSQYFWPQTGINYLTPGTYHANYASSSSCDSTYVLNLYLSDLEIITQPMDQIITSGSNANFDVEVNPIAIIYQWQCDNGAGFYNLTDNSFVVGSNTHHLELQNPDLSWDGASFRCITNFDNCIDTTRIVYLQINLGIESIQVEDIKCYPNPFNERLTLEVPHTLIGANVEVFSITGQILYTQKINQISENIEINHFDRGLYFLKITSECGDSYLKRIWKQE